MRMLQMKCKGMPPLRLVLLPGLDGTGDLFAPLVSALPIAIPTDIVALPEDPRKNYSEIVADVCSKLPREVGYILVGESFSGPLAIMIAAQHPRHLHGLIICASFLSAPVPPWLPPPVLWALACAIKFLPNWVLSHFLLDDKKNKVNSNACCSIVKRIPFALLYARMRALQHIDVAGLFEQCTVPILALVGSEDRLLRRRFTREMRRVKNDLTVVEIKSGHLLLQDSPGDASAVISQAYLRWTHVTETG